jgi:uncharacterized membrane protein (GlpM family)
VATPRLVFLTAAGLSRRLLFGLWYLVVYLIGLGVVLILSEWMRLDRAVVAVLTIAITAAVSFLGGRLLFDVRSSRAADG